MKNKKTLQIGDMTLTPEARNRYVTLEIGGKKTRVHYKELWGAVFVLGDGAYREQMMPAKKEERMVFSRKLRIAATKDIKAGDAITVWVEFDVAQDVAQAIAEQNGAKLLAPAELSTPAPNVPVADGSTL